MPEKSAFQSFKLVFVCMVHSICAVKCMKIFDICALCIVIKSKPEPGDFFFFLFIDTHAGHTPTS